MILGALFDLGLDFKEWKKQIELLKLPGIELEIKSVTKHSISATQFFVYEPKAREHSNVHTRDFSLINHHASAITVRGLKEISQIIMNSDLSENVKQNSLKVFTRLAEVEAKIHGTSVAQIHFHEVGALDAIVDIVGACIGFEMLSIDTFMTTPFTFGFGTVSTSHGIMSVPVPATVALSEGFPSSRLNVQGELCTPTGTALVTTFAKPMPFDFKVVQKKHGYGAGSRNLPDRANVLRICLLENLLVASQIPRDKYPVYQVECNLDNMAPELVANLAERLMVLGCNDVWQESIHMKKNRLAIKLCALVDESLLSSSLALISNESTTGGVRYFPVQRLVAEKSSLKLDTPYGSVEMKGVFFPGMNEPRYTPEYESCKNVALTNQVPLAEVYQAAIAAALHATKPELG